MPIVFLHGLLGSQTDWQAVISHLQSFPQFAPLTLDLPFHGKSQHLSTQGFADLRQQLHQVLNQLIGNQPFHLVGYSLGGRVALDYVLNQPHPFLQTTILEGANIGLTTEAERQARWQNDQQWANRFRQEPMGKVLADWYQQPVFAHLSPNKRLDFIAKRQHNNGQRIAQMLEATSLAKQDNYVQVKAQLKAQVNAQVNAQAKYRLHAKSQQKKIVFFIGEQDQKFRQLVEQHQFYHQLISQAGHNAHQENPLDFVKKLIAELKG